MKAPNSNTLKALRIVMGAIGAEVRDEQVQIIAHELANYPEHQVLGALGRCKVECKYRLSLADVIERIDDGHPGPEEAWAMVPKSEAETAVLTDEIAGAIPSDLVASGDITAARMAFREAYSRALAKARAERRPPRWWASLGHDQTLREPALRKAVELGRLGRLQVDKLLPVPITNPDVLLIADRAAAAMRPDFTALRDQVKARQCDACHRPAATPERLCVLHLAARAASLE